MGLVLGPALCDDHVLVLDITALLQALTTPRSLSATASGDRKSKYPIICIAGCCAPAANGQAVAALQSSVMNSRRCITRSPRRRVAEDAKAPRGRAPSRS